ncbi:cytochrome P450, partial [Neoconidiobolus thromboides FSU 785]
YNLYFSPCAHIPGPLASQLNPFTDLYYMIRGDFHVYVTGLHHRYGPVVRLGFDRICINDPEAWKQIHNNYKFSKTSFYDHMRTVGWSMISIKDRNQHSGRRRTVAKAFSESNILNLEA